MREVVLVVHNVRSAHNVGSLLRTAEGLGVQEVYLTGYTPHPRREHDKRLPHEASKVDRAITKTALGAEKMIAWRQASIKQALTQLRSTGFQIVALEQDPKATKLSDFKPTSKIALVVGREVEGIEREVLEQVDRIVEIPMLGKKESFNVTQASAIALYCLRYID